MTRSNLVIIAPADFETCKRYIELKNKENLTEEEKKELKYIEEKIKKMKTGNKILYSFPEFNGDMYPEGNLETFRLLVRENLKNFNSNNSFEEHIKSFVEIMKNFKLLINFFNEKIYNNYNKENEYIKRYLRTTIIKDKKTNEEKEVIKYKNLLSLLPPDYITIVNLTNEEIGVLLKYSKKIDFYLKPGKEATITSKGQKTIWTNPRTEKTYDVTRQPIKFYIEEKKLKKEDVNINYKEIEKLINEYSKIIEEKNNKKELKQNNNFNISL